MPALAFVNQTERLRRIIGSALDGAELDSVDVEDGNYVIRAKRRGKRVCLRFLGVSAVSRPALVTGMSLRLAAVRAEKTSLLSLLLPVVFGGPRIGNARVRIEAGGGRLEIDFQDAEWWEDEAAGE